MINSDGLITQEKFDSFIDGCVYCHGFAEALSEYTQRQIAIHGELYTQFAAKLLPEIRANPKILENGEKRKILTIGEMLGFGVITGGNLKEDIVVAQGLEDVIKILKAQAKVKSDYLIHLEQLVATPGFKRPENRTALRAVIPDCLYALHPITQAGYTLVVAAAMQSRPYL